MDAESVITDEAWGRIMAARDVTTREKAIRHGGTPAIPDPWRSLFGPFLGATDRPWVIGQLGQSLDGRIATPSGHSHYINGKAAITHLHRLRALVDAVVVGIGTALADDPQLTVRHVTGPDPARVVIDTRGRLPAAAKLLRDDGCRRVVVTESDCGTRLPAGVEILRVPRGPTGQLDPVAITQGLSALGFRRILVEGGTATVSAFLAARCLDRLHLAIAPIILGSGPVGLSLPAIERVEQGLRPATALYRLGEDLLIDCDLARA